jgi:hypothetical protein
MTITPEDVERHRALDILANKMSARTFREKQVRQRAEEEFVDRVASDIREEEEAMRFAAGLTRDQEDVLFEQRGPDVAVEIMKYLSMHDGTPEEALAALYRIAGDEAGEYVDMLTRAFGRRVRQFGPDPVGDLSREEFNFVHPRNGHHKPTKSDVIALVDGWRQMQAIQNEFDNSIDECMKGE